MSSEIQVDARRSAVPRACFSTRRSAVTSVVVIAALMLTALVPLAASAAGRDAGSEFRVTDAERAVMRAILVEEVDVYFSGGAAVLTEVQPQLARPDVPPVISAQKLADAYRDNEVAADVAYKGKRVAVHGTIQSISKDAMDKPFVALKTKDPLRQVAARFPDSRLAQLVTLKRDQKVAVVCTGSGLRLQQTILSECEVVDASFHGAVADRLLIDIERSLAAAATKPPTLGGLGVFLLALARSTSQTPACAGKLNSRGCEPDKKKLKTSFESVLADLRAAGVAWADQIKP